MKIEEIKIGQEYWVPAHLTRTGRTPEKYPVFRVYADGMAGMEEAEFNRKLNVDAEKLCLTEEEAREATREFEEKAEKIRNAKEIWFANASLESRLLFSNDLRKLDLKLRYGRCPKVLLCHNWDIVKASVSWFWDIEWERGSYSRSEFDKIFVSKEDALAHLAEKKKEIIEVAEEAIERWKATEIEERTE